VKGIEISTEGWFNGKDWIRPFNHTFEKKRLMASDRGPNTGCMGNVVWPTNGDKLTAQVVEPLAPLLEKVGYVGPIDVNCIVDDTDAYFLEFTPRFGYEAIQAWGELLQEKLFDFLYGVASGQPIEVPYHDESSIAIRLSVSPYPNKEDIEKWKGVQVLDIPKEARKHIWLADVMKPDGIEVLAGVDGVVGCVTARGQSVRECQRRAYRTVKNICIHQDVQYRTDIGDGAEQDKEKLKEWGWL
jgi:phosphoribosylamine--glycine ligase